MASSALHKTVQPVAHASLRMVMLMFDEVEVLDFAGPYEVFTTASRVHAKQGRPGPPPFTLQTVSRDGGPVRARAGLVCQTDAAFTDAPAADWLLVPGGVVDGPLACTETLAWVAAQADQAQGVASVCTGAFILAAAGVLVDGEATTHWEDVADLRRQHPGLQVREDLRWVDRGRLVTSAGISAGLDMSLHLVARLAGVDLARATARQMDYRWEERA